MAIREIEPRHLGVVTALDNWIVDNLGEVARLPNENEWTRYVDGPLDGRIGMSFALQWRYNFGWLFGARRAESEGEDLVLAVEGEELVE